MEKKLVLALLMVTILAGGVFAQGLLSAGAGLELRSMSVAWSPASTTMDKNANQLGAYLFFDAKYVELSAEYVYEKWEYKIYSLTYSWTYNNLAFGLLGKYPFALGSKFALFPYAGVDIFMPLSVTYEITIGSSSASASEDADTANNTRFSIQFGIGADYNISDTMYLRLMAGYAIGLPTKNEQKILDAVSGTGLTVGYIPIKLALGYRF